MPDIKDYKTYTYLSQEIYNILYINKETYNFNNNYLLCNYSKLSIKSKYEIYNLFNR